MSSAGHKGFKGSRKSTPYAAQIAAEDVEIKQKSMVLSLKVEVSGPGSGRESALRSLQSIGYIISSIKMLHLYLTMVVGLENVEEFNFKGVNWYRKIGANWLNLTKWK